MTQIREVAADDRSVLWAPFEERLRTETSPRRRQILETIIEHLRTESAGDLDGVMATVAPDAAFSTPYCTGPEGWDEIRTHYAAVFAAGGIGNMSVETHSILVDDDALMNEYTFTLIMPAAMAREQGLEVGDEGHYAVSQRACTVLPFDPQGRLRGELSYSKSLPLTPERVPDEELSPGYFAWLAGLPDPTTAAHLT